MSRNINDLIDRIKTLDVKEEEYSAYLELLSLDKPLFIQIMIGIVDGKISPRDFKTILSDLREEIHIELNTSDEPSLTSRIIEKYDKGETSYVLVKKDKTTEQIYIRDRALDQGIPLVGDQWKSIFVSEDNFGILTLNFDDIDLTKQDRIFMAERGLTEIQMKKLKLTRDSIRLRKPYKKGE